MHMLELLLLHSIILQIILQSGLRGWTGEEGAKMREILLAIFAAQ